MSEAVTKGSCGREETREKVAAMGWWGLHIYLDKGFLFLFHSKLQRELILNFLVGSI